MTRRQNFIRYLAAAREEGFGDRECDCLRGSLLLWDDGLKHADSAQLKRKVQETVLAFRAHPEAALLEQSQHGEVFG